jgi:UDP-GlcNAc3NAcA epimerase
MAQLLGGLNQVSEKIRVVLPMHPRTRSALNNSEKIWAPAPNLVVIEPLPYLDMLRLVDAAAIVLTDSGGLQKEAFILGRPCITLRDQTEWTETVAAGANVIVGKDIGRLCAQVDAWQRRGWGRAESFGSKALATYGEGRAAEHIIEAVVRLRPPSR